MTDSRNRPRTPRLRACKVCARVRYVKGRGLCGLCWDAADRDGTLGEHGSRPDRQAQVVAAWNAGITQPADIARHLGVTGDAVYAALKAARRNGHIPPVEPTQPWYVQMTPAPTPVPCAGEVMDFDGLKPAELTPSRNAHVAAGLALCASCPLATRQWCIDVMQPQTAGREWQGIAGGVVWSNGRVVYMPAEPVAVAS